MIAKEFLRVFLYYLKKRPYKKKLYIETQIRTINNNLDKDFYFGYYDRSPARNGIVLFHEMNDGYVNIIVKNLHSNEETIIAKSKAYNWQLGTRVMWIDDDTIAYNDFDGKQYICYLFSIRKNSIVTTFEKPIQDYSNRGFFLGVNYQRLRSYAKEYGYYCLPELSEKEFDDYEHDGIWMIDAKTGEHKLLLSLQQVVNCKTNKRFEKGKHFVNHIMISPNGDAFLFIHRYYIGKQRFDRLMYFDFNTLKCLLDDQVQSHYCWLNDNTVFGYGGYQGKNGFHSINVLTGEVNLCEELTEIHPKDGHPTSHGDWVIVDSYPNLSRMQELTAYNLRTKKHYKLLEVFHDLKHKGFDRCDLHPRFSDDGKSIYIDTIYNGKRQLCSIDVSKVIC